MAHFCPKINCPNKFSLGLESDEDALDIVCMNCNKVIYTSEKESKKRLYNWLIFPSAFILVFALMMFAKKCNPANSELKQSVIEVAKTPIELDFGLLENKIKVNEIFLPKIKSTPIPKTYSWDFGDGNEFKNETPEKYQYKKAGRYKIIFTSEGKKIVNEIEVLENKKTEPGKVSYNDQDGDGVIDNRDSCQGSRQGVLVDKFGCELKDTDNDGVFDNKDACPRTPRGVQVDLNGCEKNELPKPIWYEDSDKDDKGDPNKTAIGNKPVNGVWVLVANDKCPQRKGLSPDGCPTFEIKSNNGNIKEDISLELISDGGFLTSDKIVWSENPDLQFANKIGTVNSFKADIVGKYTIYCRIENNAAPVSENFKKEVQVKMSNAQLENIIKPIHIKGISRGSGSYKDASDRAFAELTKHFLTTSIPLYDENQVIDKAGVIARLKTDFANDNKVVSYKVRKIDYDKNSGKISAVHMKIDMK